MANYKTSDTDLISVADAIRTKGGTSSSLVYPTGWVTAIDNLKTVPTPVTAGQTPVILNASMFRSNATTLTDTGISITIPAAGTYRIKWVAFRTNTSSSYTWGTQLTKNGTLIGTEVTSWTQSYIQINQLEVTCAKNDVISISARGRGGTYYVFTGHLAACVTATLF